MKRFLNNLTAAALVLIGSALVAQAQGADRRGLVRPEGVIAFETLDGLYVVSASGGRPSKIGGTGPGDGDPVWSPDGTLIAFDSEQDNNGAVDADAPRDVYVVHSDGSHRRRLTSSRSDDGWPTWATDGRSLVFQSDRDGGAAVYVVSLQTGQARRVSYGGWYPQWLPDRRILFSDDVHRIVTIRPYGTDRQEFPTRSGGAVSVRLSPDQQTIVYTTEDPHKLFVAGTHGGASTPLVVTSGQVDDPVWSPGGQWIAYDLAPNEKDYGDIYVIHPDGSSKTRVTNLGTACCASWQATPSP